MNETKIKQVIFDSIRAIAPDTTPEDLDPNENIQEALDIDSFDFLNVLIGIDKAIGIEVPEADYGQVMTLNGLTSYLMSRVVV
jgi:acyl carrier protein